MSGIRDQIVNVDSLINLSEGAPVSKGFNWKVLIIVNVIGFFIILALSNFFAPKKQEELFIGDRVLVNGGIYGTVQRIDSQHGTVFVEVDEHCILKVNKKSVEKII